MECTLIIYTQHIPDPLPFPIHPTLSYFFNLNSSSTIYFTHIILVVNLPGTSKSFRTHTFQKIASAYPSIYKLHGVIWLEICFVLTCLLHAGIFVWLQFVKVLCLLLKPLWIHLGNHIVVPRKYCFLLSSTIFNSCNALLHLPQWSLYLGRRGVTQMSLLGMSVSHSLIIYTLISCGSLLIAI